jgi:bacillithiol system protein YtxJ
MAVERLILSQDPEEAVEALREASKLALVLVFKKSPICGTSLWAEEELNRWLASRTESLPLKLVEIDVIAQRSLARGITTLLSITHASPQALLLADGEVRWHGSHNDLNVETFQSKVDIRTA